MKDDVLVIATVSSVAAMVAAVVTWVVLGVKHDAASVAVGALVGVFVGAYLSRQAFLLHHSARQPRDENGRFVPVKRRGRVVDWLLIDGEDAEKPPKSGKKGGGAVGEGG
jgi:hypothetical protein